jgi:hypothetical protein
MKGLYKRGDVWWFRFSHEGSQHRRSLLTTSEEEAMMKAESILATECANHSSIESFFQSQRQNGSSFSGPRREAWVYLMRCVDRYKIGVTTNVEARRASIMAHCPYEVSVVAKARFGSERTAYFFERKLHRRFASARVHFEWFALTEEDALALSTELHARP